MVQDNIRIVFQALNEICSGGDGLTSALADNKKRRELDIFKIMHQVISQISIK